MQIIEHIAFSTWFESPKDSALKSKFISDWLGFAFMGILAIIKCLIVS